MRTWAHSGPQLQQGKHRRRGRSPGIGQILISSGCSLTLIATFSQCQDPLILDTTLVVRLGSMTLSVGKGPWSLIQMGGIVGTEYLNCIQDIYEKLALHSQEQKWNQKLRCTRWTTLCNMYAMDKMYEMFKMNEIYTIYEYESIGQWPVLATRNRWRHTSHQELPGQEKGSRHKKSKKF